jgi:hypothetical protein
VIITFFSNTSTIPTESYENIFENRTPEISVLNPPEMLRQYFETDFQIGFPYLMHINLLEQSLIHLIPAPKITFKKEEKLCLHGLP